MSDAYFDALVSSYPYGDIDHISAGTWFNEHEWDDSLAEGVLTTSYEHILKTIKENPEVTNFSVLVATGAMAPLHTGHIAMLEAAKIRVEAEGEIVAGGFVHPDNDAYVSNKLKSRSYGAMKRFKAANDLLIDYPWIKVDMWASLWVGVALNFTTILQRTENYLSELFPDLNFKVYHVFGGDNYYFAPAFYAHGQAVCVRRGEDISWMFDQRWFNSERVLTVDSDVSTLSSTIVRKQLKKAPKELLPKGIFVVNNDLFGFTIGNSSLLSFSIESAIRERIPATVEFESIIEGDEGFAESEVFSNVSLKNFVVGSIAGGVGFELPDGSDSLAPMMFPYFDLTSVGVEPKQVINLSYELWSLNYEFYKELNSVVSDLPTLSAALWEDIGFGVNQKVSDVCLWHVLKLEKML